MSTLLDKLDSGIILLSDGAMGTELQKKGLAPGGCPEEFNVTHPDIIRNIYQSYFNSGSDIVETNTFGANRSRLGLHDFGDRVPEFCTSAVRLAKEVCPEGKYVAGSMGPTGDILEPLGSRSHQEAYDIFLEQACALTEGGADLLLIETMMALEEVEIAVRAAKDASNLPVATTMTFEKGKAGLRTVWGVTIPGAIDSLMSLGVDVIGANCGTGFEEMVAIVREMRPLTQLPIIAQANAGIPIWDQGVAVYKETPGHIAHFVSELLSAGVNILGGCCGTGPDHISSMRKFIDQANASKV